MKETIRSPIKPGFVEITRIILTKNCCVSRRLSKFKGKGYLFRKTCVF